MEVWHNGVVREFFIKAFFLGALAFWGFAFLAGCGTQTSYYLYPAPTVFHEPKYNTGYDERYFEFRAASGGDQKEIDESFAYQGTCVYYKIWNNVSNMLSANSSIDSLNESDNEQSAANSVISSYGYKQLGLNYGEREPLIGDGGGRVKIHLTNYQENQLSGQEFLDYDFRSYIKIDGNDIGIPLRYENKFTFDFGRKEDDVNLVASSQHKVDKNVKNAKPKSDDSSGDVRQDSSSTEAGVWYVDMYAISMGHDNNFAKYYSKVLHLGCVPIDTGSEHN